MKKNILVFLCLCSTFTYAQKPVLKAGSLISIENKKEIRAKNVNVGDLVAFDVSEDIKHCNIKRGKGIRKSTRCKEIWYCRNKG